MLDAVQQRVLAAIPVGKKNAVISDVIRIRADIHDEKRTNYKTREVIRELRFAGHPILSNTKVGFWLSNDREEIMEYCRSLKRRSDEILKTLKAMEGILCTTT